MVHKKSEYRLQFHLLAKDLRKQIWQDNIKFRESRRSVNQAHHFWDYQLTDENCVCETDCGEGEVDDSLLPPHKLKHKTLLAKYGPQGTKNGFASQRQVQLVPPETEPTSAREIAVQTPDWALDENRTEDASTSHELQNLMQNLSTSTASELGGQSQVQQPPEERLRPASPVPPRSPDRPRTSGSLLPRPVSVFGLREDPRNVGKSSLSHKSESARLQSPSRFSALSRTSRKSYFEDKKSPFVSYGWNDTERDVGTKKTYNVQAPTNEVYPRALNALKCRKADIEKFLAREAEKAGQGLSSRSGINHSSIWMTEYQEKYAQTYNKPGYTEKCIRPASTSILKKPVDWRYS